MDKEKIQSALTQLSGHSLFANDYANSVLKLMEKPGFTEGALVSHVQGIRQHVDKMKELLDQISN